MKKFVLRTSHFFYRHVAKPIFFLFDAEFVHNSITNFGGIMGRIKPACNLLQKFTATNNPALSQTIANVSFENPVGLAAGFDYEAKLTQILPAVGFGFQTIGTITNNPYKGNAKPRLGRLVKSRSLLVNKGFKNLGIKKTLNKIENKSFKIPVGISIGVTNNPVISTLEAGIFDIANAFKVAESSPAHFSYYELNISCPNLKVDINFNLPENLEKILTAIFDIKIKKHLFIKMPTDRTDSETLLMLEVISKYPVAGVIFGNLQKNKNDPAINQIEAKRFSQGYFSGKPTEKRSNELISLAYKNFGKKFIIIGCGGIFCAKDAYAKIKLGASLVQLITGMIYEGPQLIAQINLELLDLLKQDGFNNISEAIGSGHN